MQFSTIVAIRTVGVVQAVIEGLMREANSRDGAIKQKGSACANIVGSIVP